MIKKVSDICNQINTKVLVFLFQLLILLEAISGMDIFFPATYFNKMGTLSFLKITYFTSLLILISSICIAINKGIPRIRAIHILVLLYCLTLSISSLIAHIQLFGVYKLFSGWRGPILFLIFSYIPAIEKKVKNIIYSFILLGLFSSLFALVQEYIYLCSGKSLYGIVEILGIHFIRVNALMSYCNYLAFYLGISLLFLINYTDNVTIKRWAVKIIFLIVSTALFFTFSRSNFLALLITFLFASNFILKSKNRKIFLIELVTVVLTISIFYARGNNSIHSRLVLLQESITIFLNHPLFGIGYGNVAHYTSEFVNPHNEFLSIAASCGIFSLLIFILFLYCIYIEASEIYKSNQHLGQTLMNCCIYILIFSMFQELMTNAWIIFGLIDLAYRTEKLKLES